jgi:hypothetical protein
MATEPYWECPRCYWRMHDVEYLAIKFDGLCPCCEGKKFSEFRYREVAAHE